MLVKPGTLSKDERMYGLPVGTVITDQVLQTVRLNGPTLKNKLVIDWPSGLGSNLFGYGQFDAAMPQASPSLVTSFEHEAANKLAEFVCGRLGWDRAGVVFAKTGSDATTMAVRIARAVTGRRSVMTFEGHYHGWHDWTVQRTQPAKGVFKTDDILESKWGEDFFFGNFAALIFEHPVGAPSRKWVDTINAIRNKGALLIADEIVTGFRYAPGLISARYGYQPDLVCLGKALGNGAALSTVVGKLDIMQAAFDNDNPVFCSSTNWGEVSALSIACQILHKYKDAAYIAEIGKAARDALAEADFTTWGDDERFMLNYGSDEDRGAIIRGFVDNGHLVNRPFFATFAHTENDAKSLGEAAQKVKVNLARYKDGPTPRVLFRTR